MASILEIQIMQIISPNHFKILPWKNGKGTTTELAISPSGSLEHFDWRLSIATVSEDGPFSNFAGIMRNLILIEGTGIELTHDEQKTDILNSILDFATFNGGCSTMGKLINGTIKDFNLMHNPAKFDAEVFTIKHSQSMSFRPSDWCFIYGLNAAFQMTFDSKLDKNNSKPITVEPNHLVILNSSDTKSLSVFGEQLIVIQLTLPTQQGFN
jgi:uncharacterized protein